jgi:hypothetical protein
VLRAEFGNFSGADIDPYLARADGIIHHAAVEHFAFLRVSELEGERATLERLQQHAAEQRDAEESAALAEEEEPAAEEADLLTYTHGSFVAPQSPQGASPMRSEAVETFCSKCQTCRMCCVCSLVSRMSPARRPR